MKIVSGGQTGADQGGLRAARRAGIATGGLAPLGWLTEAGPAPWLEEFGLAQHDRPGYDGRTKANCMDADMTLLFVWKKSAGSNLTLRVLHEFNKPYLIVDKTMTIVENKIDNFEALKKSDEVIINVAGNRESVAKGIGKAVEEWLVDYLDKR